MPRNYDQMRAARDLDFIVGGNTFTVHLLPLSTIDVWTERESKVNPEKNDEFREMVIERIADAVADGNGSADRWREVCASDRGPAYAELMDLFRWVWEVQSTLPTMPPEPSPSGRAKTPPSSKAA